MTRTRILIVILGLLAVPAMASRALPEPVAVYSEARYVMGTILEITLYHTSPEAARTLLDRAFNLAEGLDQRLSNYKPQSEINQLNARAGKGKVKVSHELYAFLVASKRLAEKTHGKFDITIGPIVNLWARAARAKKLPSAEAVEAARARVGFAKIQLYPDFQAELTREGMALDSGGIGKGYAVDQIAALLRGARIERALVNFGQSSIFALGAPPRSRAWRLLLGFPDQRPVGVLELKDQAFAASDSFGKTLRIGGRIYGHLVDPELGRPLTRRIRAAVASPSATDAEALSKYAVLEEKILEKSRQDWTEVQILRVSDDGKTLRSKGFPLKSQTDLQHSAS